MGPGPICGKLNCFPTAPRPEQIAAFEELRELEDELERRSRD